MKRFAMALIGLLLTQGLALAEGTAGSTEPEVVIKPRDDSKVKEYRVNGRLYMIEITPSKGPHYFLVDTDGDGSLETRLNGPVSSVQIPSWTLLRW